MALTSGARYYFVITIGEQVVADIRRDLFAHLTELSPGFYDQEQSGEIVSRLTADTTQIKSVFGATASMALRNAILGLGALVMMIVTSPRLSVMVIAAIPVIVLPLVMFGRTVRRRSREAQDMLAEATAFASEAVSSIRTLQAFVNEKLVTGRFAKAVDTAYEAARGSIKSRAFLTAFAIFMIFGSVVGVLWVGAQGVLERHDFGGHAQPVPALFGLCRQRARHLVGSLERNLAGGGRVGADCGNPRRAPRHSGAGESGAASCQAHRLAGF